MPSVFSQIINRRIPANIVCENKDFIAFMDIMPIQKGHILVVFYKDLEQLNLPFSLNFDR